MKCLDCGGATSVDETRATSKGTRRRRRCKCGFAFTTYETAAKEAAPKDKKTAPSPGADLQRLW
jgi:transcriptional regulator NrdR family protein